MISTQEFVNMANGIRSECDFYEFIGCKDCQYHVHDARAGQDVCIFESITGNPPYLWVVRKAAFNEEEDK